MISPLYNKLFDEYYKNGILATYKKQQELSDFFESSNRNRISTSIKSMIDKKIIIPHNDVWKRRRIIIYELGTHDKDVNKHETLHLHRYLVKLDADKKLEKMIVGK